MKKLALILGLLFSNILFSQTTLSAGDIAILQYNSDGTPEVIKFVTLVNLEAGTVINFTDHGWENTGSFRDTEGVVAWTAPREYHCGEIITMDMPTGADLVTIDLGFDLAVGGDQIIVFQGDVLTPTLIFAINNEGSAIWQTTSTSSNTSAVPTGLTDGVNAVAIAEIDNAKYTGPLTGSRNTVLANICTAANWTGSNSLEQTFTGIFNTTWNGSTWDGAGSDFLSATVNGNFTTSTNGNFSACNCTVNAGNTLTINSGDTFTVENDITNNGTITVESTGAVVQILPTGTNSGTDYTVERISTSQLEEGNYTYWSSPLNSSTLIEVTNAQKYFSYTATSQSWSVASASTSMTPGVGYISTGNSGITYPNSYTAAFSGSSFNNGDINTTVSLGSATFAGASDNWNLLGNPYPSAIDSELFTAGNTNLNGTVYYWTHATADSAGDNIQADYAMYNTTGGTGGGSRYIASGQGFFIQANASGIATFTNAMRVAGNNATFYKTKLKQPQQDKDRIWLSLTKGSVKQEILIGFLENATDGVDRLYDGIKLDAGLPFNFYSLIEDAAYGIQGKGLLKEKEEIPLGFKSNLEGVFKISIDKFEGRLKDASIFLVDNLLGVQHNLKDTDYNFTITETGKFNNRFQLIINKNSEVLAVEENDYLKPISIEKSKNSITVRSLKNIKIKKVILYNLLGQEQFKTKNDRSVVTINSQSLKINTVLILKTILEDGQISTNRIWND